MRFLSTRAHSIIGIIIAITLIFAPNIFGFTDVDSAEAVARFLGIFLLISELITDSGFSLAKIIPMNVHLMMDYTAGVFLAVSPWLFGFADEEANAWVPHLIVGLLIIGYALVTKVPEVSSVNT